MDNNIYLNYIFGNMIDDLNYIKLMSLFLRDIKR
jgi:hypothetical protein